MHGIKRVIVFCTLTTFLPTMLLVIPLYLRHNFYANVAYAVTESDILEIDDGISTIFCSEHTLQMNGSFNAFQMSHKPEITSYRKHIRLKKSMLLPDDTLEYWGFYLLKGATVALSVCSRFQGASILVVKGEKNLRTCGMLEHNDNKLRATGIFLPEADRQVKITFESSAQEINSKEFHSTTNRKIVGKDPRKLREVKENNKGAIFNETAEKLFRSAQTYLDRHVDEKGEEKKVERRLRHAKKRLRRVQMEKRRKEREKEMYEEKLKSMVQEEKGNNSEDLKVESNGQRSNDEKIGRNTKFGLRNRRKRSQEKSRNNLLRDLQMELNSEEKMEEVDNGPGNRIKRSQDPVEPPFLLDQGIKHGGNAIRNLTDDESSVSSFEMGLFDCYEGAILIAQEFEPSEHCVNVSYLLSGKHMQTRHNVVEDGYYYYIFYSDNDFNNNDIHALFDIYKPTFQYENVTKACINKTECSFALTPMSGDRVIVEIPTRDGIEHELDDYNLLVSICHPRMGTYMIFPIAVLFFILGCAFL